MKQLITLLFAVFSISTFATVRTVSNIDSSAQFRTIQAACDASTSGDSIYVRRSTINYDDFTINNKKLAIFGPGWSPFVPGIAFISRCDLKGTGASTKKFLQRRVTVART